MGSGALPPPDAIGIGFPPPPQPLSTPAALTVLPGTRSKHICHPNPTPCHPGVQQDTGGQPSALPGCWHRGLEHLPRRAWAALAKRALVPALGRGCRGQRCPPCARGSKHSHSSLGQGPRLSPAPRLHPASKHMRRATLLCWGLRAWAGPRARRGAGHSAAPTSPYSHQLLPGHWSWQRDSKPPGGNTEVGPSCPREMLELQLSATTFWHYQRQHLNKPRLTQLACSLCLGPGARLPWQGL